LDISDDMTISELEYRFRENFGFPARVYQKSGDYWQKSSSLDRLRLKHEQLVVS
jgi:hypothetical protein